MHRQERVFHELKAPFQSCSSKERKTNPATFCFGACRPRWPTFTTVKSTSVCLGLVCYRVESSWIKCYWQIKREGRKDNVHSPPDLSLPDVTARVTPRIHSLLLLLSIPFLYIHSLSFSSLYLCSRRKKKKKKGRRALHQLSGPSVWWDPSFLLSLSLSALSSSLLLSSPCCDRAHLLDLGFSGSESNYLAATSRSHPLTGFLGVELTSPLSALILLRTGRTSLPSEFLCITGNLSFL